MNDPTEPNESQAPAERPVARIDINLDHLKQISYLGVRRAAAFLGIGLNATSGGQRPALALADQSFWRFFPTPEPPELVENAISEFRMWVTGNALRELDAHFSMFLDQVWFNLEFAKLHGNAVRSDFIANSIAKDTNAARKYEKLLRELGVEGEHGKSLWSLSNARNCLTHAHGIVTARHAKADGALEVYWRGLEMRLQQGDDYVVMAPGIVDRQGLQAHDPSKEAEVIMAVIGRTKRFEIEQKVVFEPNELHEICFNYQLMTDKLIAAFHTFLVSKGVEMRPPTSPTT